MNVKALASSRAASHMVGNTTEHLGYVATKAAGDENQSEVAVLDPAIQILIIFLFSTYMAQKNELKHYDLFMGKKGGII